MIVGEQDYTTQIWRVRQVKSLLEIITTKGFIRFNLSLWNKTKKRMQIKYDVMLKKKECSYTVAFIRRKGVNVTCNVSEQ